MVYFYLLLLTLLVITTFLPVEIRFAKKVYRSIVLVWANEVSKAWHE